MSTLVLESMQWANLEQTTDAECRQHLVRPVKRRYPEQNGFTAQTTIVSFDEHGYSQNCGCDPRSSGHHHT